MPIPTTLKPLSTLIRRLGYPDSEAFAAHVLKEGPHDLLAALFVQQAWKRYVIKDGDTSWIDDEIAKAIEGPSQPGAGLGHALKRCREAGVSDKDLTEMARCHQAATLFHVCYLLDDPCFEEEELDDVAWGLFQVDEHDQPIGPPIEGIHELVLSADPTGREMRPK